MGESPWRFKSSPRHQIDCLSRFSRLAIKVEGPITSPVGRGSIAHPAFNCLYRILRPTQPAVEGIIGSDDALNQGMAHDVSGIEEGEADTLHPTENLDRLA